MNAIVIQGLSKSFKKSAVRREYTSFKSEFVRWITRRQRAELPASSVIPALNGIDLVVPKGKTVGIIGRNGSGKSTLLKLITGIYTPTSGKIEVNGRISALLDLGAGFHPDFTGRENILVNGIILGMSRDEVIRRTPEIIAFSELGDFIDEPVRTYSSGMFMRLAFAVATHVDPELLIVDEILAVGDEHFSRKSRAKMEEFKAKGNTILLVTHDLNTLRTWCDLGVWIDGGKIRQVGDPHHVVEAYRKAVALAEAQQQQGAASALNAPGLALPELQGAARPSYGPVDVPPTQRWGNFRGEISSVKLLSASGAEVGTYDPEASLDVRIEFATNEDLIDAGFRVSLRRADGAEVYTVSSFDEGVRLPVPLPRTGAIHFTIDRLGLVAGTYFVDVALTTRSGVEYDVQRSLHGFAVQTRSPESGIARPPHRWTFEAPDAAAARTGSHG